MLTKRGDYAPAINNAAHSLPLHNQPPQPHQAALPYGQPQYTGVAFAQPPLQHQAYAPYTSHTQPAAPLQPNGTGAATEYYSYNAPPPYQPDLKDPPVGVVELGPGK